MKFKKNTQKKHFLIMQIIRTLSLNLFFVTLLLRWCSYWNFLELLQLVSFIGSFFLKLHWINIFILFILKPAQVNMFGLSLGLLKDINLDQIFVKQVVLIVRICYNSLGIMILICSSLNKILRSWNIFLIFTCECILVDLKESASS